MPQPIYAASGLIETYRPGSYVEWSAQAIASEPPPSADKVVGLIGYADGGAPLTNYSFTTERAAEAVLQYGELLDAVKLAFRGNGGGERPRIVRAVNVRGGTQANYVVLDTAAGVFGTYKTVAYRERANQTQISLTGSRAAGGFTLTIQDAGTDLYLRRNGIGRALLVQYIGGSSPTATATVTELSGLRSFKTSVPGRTADNLEIPLTAGMSAETLVERINKTGKYSAYIGRDSRLDVSQLDVVATAVSIMPYTSVGSVTAAAAAGATSLTVTLSRAVALGEVLRFYSSFGPILVVTTAAALISATTLSVQPLQDDITSGTNLFDDVPLEPRLFLAVKSDFNLVALTSANGLVTWTPGASILDPALIPSARFVGGATATTPVRDWGTAADKLLSKPVGYVVALSDTDTIQIGVQAVVTESRSARVGKFVMMIRPVPSDYLPDDSGTLAIANYVDTLASNIATVNDRDVLYLVSTHDIVNPSTGRLERTKPYMVAAQVAGLKASIGPSEPLTYKTLNGTRAFPDFTPEQSDRMVKVGGLCLENVEDGAATRIVRGRTSYIGVDNAILEGEMQVAIMNSIARSVKAIQSQWIPGKATPSRLSGMQNDILDFYKKREDEEWITAGLLNGVQVPAYEFKLFPTTNSGQRAYHTSLLNPVGELLVGDAKLVARAVEITIEV